MKSTDYNWEKKCRYNLFWENVWATSACHKENRFSKRIINGEMEEKEWSIACTVPRMCVSLPNTDLGLWSTLSRHWLTLFLIGLGPNQQTNKGIIKGDLVELQVARVGTLKLRIHQWIFQLDRDMVNFNMIVNFYF